MSKYCKFNIVYHLQKWMDSVAGQTFLNYAYSWGASVVILGALFKLTHLPGADFFLFFGMGTEVVVFFISAFDRPFDKTTDGINLQKEQRLEEARKLYDRLPDDEQSQNMKKTVTAINEIYKLQLTKASSQMATIEDIDKSLHILAGNLEKLNEVYARMIAAIKRP